MIVITLYIDTDPVKGLHLNGQECRSSNVTEREQALAAELHAVIQGKLDSLDPAKLSKEQASEQN
jgi:hypothetical protein